MSYSFDGKLSNQKPRSTNLASAKTTCSKCCRLIDFPKRNIVSINDKTYFTYDYLQEKFFIYETKSGIAAAYCSEYCKRKHNHRFS